MLENVYVFKNRGLRRQELAQMCAKGIVAEICWTKIFSSLLIFRNGLIYDNVSELFRMDELEMKYAVLKIQTPVVYLIIKALWPDECG